MKNSTLSQKFNWKAVLLTSLVVPFALGCSVKGSITNESEDASSAKNQINLDSSQLNITEGTSASILVTLNKAARKPVVLNLLLTGAPNRFQPIPLTLTIPAGSSSQTFILQTVNDSIFEGDTLYQISISTFDTDWKVTSQLKQVTLVDDEAIPVISVTSPSGNESSGQLSFMVTQNLVSMFDSKFTVNSVNGTAIAGTDFTDVTALLITIPAGQTTAQFDVAIADDGTPEANKSFTLSFSNPINATLNATSATGTIINDDNTVSAQFSTPTQSIAENGGTVTVTANLDFAAASNVVIPITFTGTAVDPTDYTSSSASLTILAGQTSGSITLSIVDDSIFEGSDTVIMTMGAPGAGAALGATTVQTVTINNDDATPSLSISDITASEAVGTLSYTVTLSSVSALPVSFDWTTLAGTATHVSGDYTYSSGSAITIAAGTTTVNISVPISDDTTFETNEAFSIQISNPVNATISTASGTVTINNNDVAPTLSISNISVNENTGTATLTVDLTAASALAVTFNYATSSGTALAPADYTSASDIDGSIAIGFMSTTFDIPISEDLLDEDDETFIVTISSMTNVANSSNPAATVTILDNDLPPTLNIADITDTELARTMDFPILLSAPSGKTITVTYSTSDVTALAGLDYTSKSAVLTIPAGTVTPVLPIPVLYRPKTQASREFLVTISGTTNSTLGTASAIARINDASPVKVPAITKNIGSAAAPLSASKAIGSKVFFTNYDSVNGEELWVSDGTDAGTFLVKDINPGITGSSIISIGELAGEAYFPANDGVNGTELWKSDGTTLGTVKVLEINAGSANAYPSGFYTWNGKLYFTATDAASGGTGFYVTDGTAGGTIRLSTTNYAGQFTVFNGNLFFTGGPRGELWKTDGTVVGTIAVTAIANSYYYPYISGLTVSASQNLLYFQATDGNTGSEPYVSNGNAGGTSKLKDIGTYSNGWAPSYAGGFTPSGPLVFFVAESVFIETFYRLWVSDGTTGGTVSISPNGVNVSNLYKVNQVFGNPIIIFPATDPASGTEIWTSDGTAIGTAILKDIYPGASSSGITMLGSVAAGTKYLFSANDGTNGTELWVTDGTPTGTNLLKDINPTGSSSVYLFTTNGTIGWFVSNDGTNGSELWMTDGTAVGTTMVKDLNPGVGSTSPRQLVTVGSNLFFLGYDSVSTLAKVGLSDGTGAGTILFPNSIVASAGANISGLTAFNNEVYFSADDGTRGNQLWHSDGSAIGTGLIKDMLPTAGCVAVSNITVVNGSLFFTAKSDAAGIEPYLSNGTGGGTALIQDANPGVADSFLGTKMVFGNKLFFSNTTTVGQEPWITDGTSAGTFALGDLNPGTFSSGGVNYQNNSSPNPLAILGGTLIFSATTSSNGTEIWKTDGTPGGTSMLEIRSGATGAFSSPSGIVLGGKYIFAADDGSVGAELWQTDGTANGTSLLKDINPGASASSPTSFTKVGSYVIFAASHASYGYEIWVTDGTPAGTILLKDSYAGTSGGLNTIFTLASGGSLAYFVANDGTNGNEIWKTDGTPGGTAMVKDINPGATGTYFSTGRFVGTHFVFDVYNSTTFQYEMWTTDGTDVGTMNINPQGISYYSFQTVIGNKMYFQATSTAYGTELYVSDGTARGTYLYDDILSGTRSSSPSGFTISNGRVYLLATDPTTGQELWSIDP